MWAFPAMLDTLPDSPLSSLVMPFSGLPVAFFRAREGEAYWSGTATVAACRRAAGAGRLRLVPTLHMHGHLDLPIDSFRLAERWNVVRNGGEVPSLDLDDVLGSTATDAFSGELSHRAPIPEASPQWRVVPPGPGMHPLDAYQAADASIATRLESGEDASSVLRDLHATTPWLLAAPVLRDAVLAAFDLPASLALEDAAAFAAVALTHGAQPFGAVQRGRKGSLPEGGRATSLARACLDLAETDRELAVDPQRLYESFRVGAMRWSRAREQVRRDDARRAQQGVPRVAVPFLSDAVEVPFGHGEDGAARDLAGAPRGEPVQLSVRVEAWAARALDDWLSGSAFPRRMMLVAGGAPRSIVWLEDFVARPEGAW